MSSRPGRNALRPTDVRTRRTMRSVPVSSGGAINSRLPGRCPAGEAIKPQPPDDASTEGAINSSRKAGVQRRKRSTPGPPNDARREEGSSLRPPSEPRGGGLVTPNPWTRPRPKGFVTPSIRPVPPAEGLVTPHSAASLLGDSMVSPCNRDHAPRFLGRETLEKPETASIITAPETRCEGLSRPSAQITSFGGSFSSKSCLHGRFAQLPALSSTTRR